MSFPTLTEKDVEDIKNGIKLDIDWFALSFVRSDKDFLAIREILDEKKSGRPVIAKVEKPEAIQNLRCVVDAFEGILVARGDLGIEMYASFMFALPKETIADFRDTIKLMHQIILHIVQ